MVSFFIVSAVWGCTNPCLRYGNESTPTITNHNNVLLNFFHQIIVTLLNWKFSIPFLLNQSGSLLYVYLLGQAEISMAVPIINSLTFMNTFIASLIFGEKQQKCNLYTIFGTLCILIGVAICILANEKRINNIMD